MNQSTDNPNKTSLTCRVEKVVFHNKENGYSVLSVTADGDSKQFSICGILNGMPKGTMLYCEGEWTEHAKFGKQFQVESWEEKKTIRPGEVAAADLAWFIAENTNHNLFLSGKAGTGKTVFLHAFVKNTRKKVVVLAPTGIAAINANAMTIHSFCRFGLAPCPLGRVSKTNDLLLDDKEEELIRNIDLIIIDEVSMVRADTMDHISEKIRLIRNSDKPFGGVQLLLIGDLYQLPPVVTKQDEKILKDYYDSNYFFFNSNAIKSVGFETVCLDKVYRQDNPEFVGILNRARVGKVTWADCDKLNTRHIPDYVAEETNPITLVAQKAQAQSINDEKLGPRMDDVDVYSAKIEGDFPKECYPTNENLCLKKGTQVMFVKNDKHNSYCNGTIGVVEDLYANAILVKVNMELIEVRTASWDNIRYEYDRETKKVTSHPVGTFTQFPLKPAWAITIHKSQGLSFDHAIIDIPRAFAAGQSYVALSRCRSLEGIVLKNKLTPNSFFVDPLVSSFYDRVDSIYHIAKLATAVGYTPVDRENNNEQEDENNVETQSSCTNENYENAFACATFQINMYHETRSKLDDDFWGIMYSIINDSGLNIYYQMKIEHKIEEIIQDMKLLRQLQ